MPELTNYLRLNKGTLLRHTHHSTFANMLFYILREGRMDFQTESYRTGKLLSDTIFFCKGKSRDSARWGTGDHFAFAPIYFQFCLWDRCRLGSTNIFLSLRHILLIDIFISLSSVLSLPIHTFRPSSNFRGICKGLHFFTAGSLGLLALWKEFSARCFCRPALRFL